MPGASASAPFPVSGADPRQAVFEMAAAKVNLSLHVTGRRADGYHLLDSLVAFADVGDGVEVSLSDVPSLTVTGPEARALDGVAREDNATLRAARHAGLVARIRLEKHLPVAAGIGGGSADAAAVLRAAARLTGQPLPPGIEKLGADVPVCLLSRGARMQGIGETVTPVSLPPIPAVLVNPRRPVPTAEVFRRLALPRAPALPEVLPPLLSLESVIAFCAGLRNDLSAAAEEVEPTIGRCLALLRRHPACRLARMSGSGATCFALADSPELARVMAGAVANEEPEWWVRACLLS